MARSDEDTAVATWTRTSRLAAESPGVFLSEGSVHDVRERTVGAALAVLPSSAFRFRFFDALTATVDVEGEPQVVRKTENHSSWHYVGGQIYDYDEVGVLAQGTGRYDVLRSNMRANKWDRVILTPKGNWHPWEDDFVYVDTSGQTVST